MYLAAVADMGAIVPSCGSAVHASVPVKFVSRVQPCDAGDMVVVDEADGLDAKLEELRGRGIDPALVVVIRRFEEATA